MARKVKTKQKRKVNKGDALINLLLSLKDREKPTIKRIPIEESIARINKEIARISAEIEQFDKEDIEYFKRASYLRMLNNDLDNLKRKKEI